MFSMSFGLSAAGRLTVWSGVELVEPLERETDARPLATDWFDTMTPSTTYSGSPAPRIDVAPRIWICMPPPGTPEFSKIDAPTTLPERFASSDFAGATTSSSADTDAMAVDALRLSTVVAWPVTVTPSS